MTRQRIRIAPRFNLTKRLALPERQFSPPQRATLTAVLTGEYLNSLPPLIAEATALAANAENGGA